MADAGRSQTVFPYLYYADGHAAIEFLCRAFGFREKLKVERDDGTVQHAELEHRGQTIMLGCPERGGTAAAPGAAPRHGSVLCFVDDVDGHHQRAVAAGARVEIPLGDRDYGARSYSSSDPEGQSWHFSTPHGSDGEPV